jgi:hypothetical protein
MAERPDVRGQGLQLLWSELRSTHRRHRAAVLFGLRHSFSDGFHDSGVASIAPQILFRREVRTQRRSFTILTMASRTGSPARVAVINALTERNHCSRGARGNRKVCGSCRAGVCMRSFRRIGLAIRQRTSRSGRARAWSTGRVGIFGTAPIHDAVNRAVDVVGDIERPVRTYGNTRRTMQGAPGRF